MPFVIAPDGSIKYGDTLEEAEQDWGEVTTPEPKTRTQSEFNDLSESTEEQPTQEVVKEGQEDKSKLPAWLEETLVVSGSFLTHLPETITEGIQKTAQKMEPWVAEGFASAAAGGQGNIFQSAFTQAREAEIQGEDPATYTKDTQETVEQNRAYARLNLTPPDEEGNFGTFGIPKEVPILGAFGEEGSIYKAFEPKTKIGEEISDIGQLITLSMLAPQISSIFGYAPAAHKSISAAKAFAAAPSKKLLLNLGKRIAIGIGAELPQDFIEEVTLFAEPELSESTEIAVDEALKIEDPDARIAAINLLAADTEMDAEYWKEYGMNTMKGMTGAIIFRSILGSLNNLRRFSKYSKKPLTKELVEETLTKGIEEVKPQVEAVTAEANNTELLDQIGRLNKEFNSDYQSALPGLNETASGMARADLAIQKVTSQLDTASAEVDALISPTAKADRDELDRIVSLTKARLGSIQEITKADKKAFNELKKKLVKQYKVEGLSTYKANKLAQAEAEATFVPYEKKSKTNRRRLNKYAKDLQSLDERYVPLQKKIAENEALLEGPRERGGIAAAQVLSMQAGRQYSVDTFIEQFRPLMNRLKDINTKRINLGVDLTNDPIYESYRRLEKLYDNYDALGGPNRAQGADIDPGLEVTRGALERQLLDGINTEYRNLQELGGVGGVDIKPKILKAAAEATNQKVPEILEEKVPTKGDEVIDEVTPEVKTEEPQVEDTDLTNTDQLPLKLNDDGNITTDADATTRTGETDLPPANKASMIREAQIMLNHRDPLSMTNEADQLVDASSALTSQQALEAYTAKVAAQNLIEEEALKAGRTLPHDWDRSATKSLARAFGSEDTRLPLYEGLKVLNGKPESVMPRVAAKIFKYADQLAGANGDFHRLEELLRIRRLRRGKAIEGVEEGILETGTVVLDIATNGELLYDAVSKLQTAALNSYETKALRLYSAQLALKTYQAIGDFMQLRALAGTFLASLKRNQLESYRKYFTNAKIKYKNAKAKDALEAAAKELDRSIDDYQANLTDLFSSQVAQQALDEVPKYIGIKSNARTVTDILTKFTDENLTPTESDIALFNKIVSQMTIAGLNPTNLGSISIRPNDLVYKQMIAQGLSSPKTQLSFPVQTGVYATANWINDAVSGKLMKVFETIGWRDPEAAAEAVRRAKLSKEMLSTITETYVDTLRWVQATRSFDKSVLTSGVTSVEDTTKFNPNPRVNDPLREQQKLDFLKSNSAPVDLPDTGLGRAIKEVWPEVSPKQWGKLKGNVMLHLAELHDQFFLGDAYEVMQGTAASGFRRLMHNISPSGISDRILPKLTGGRATPYKSKFTGGERVGGTLPLTLSETSTELIGGIYGNAFAKAKARLDVENLVDGKGRQLFKRGTKEWTDKVDEIYRSKYLTPINAGIGEKAETIAYALNDEEAIKLALSFDMMMDPGDDLTGRVSKGLQSLGSDKDLQLFKAVLTPYVRAPINAAKFHFYYSTPFVGLPVPTGAVFEATAAFTRLVNGQAAKSTEFAKMQGVIKDLTDSLGKVPTNKQIAERMEVELETVEDLVKGDHLGTRIASFESQLFHKDPTIRARAKSALTMSTLFTGAVVGFALSSDVKISGGQRTNFREAQSANVPPYSIQLFGQWVPYRWTPFIGETLAFVANYRDFQKSNNRFLSEKIIGTAIMASAQTFMDAPAVAGIDTLISAAANPAKAEQLILDYFLKVGGVRYTALRSWALRAGLEAYGSRPILSGGRAGMVGSGKTYSETLNRNVLKREVDGLPKDEETTWFEQVQSRGKNIMWIDFSALLNYL